MGQFMVSYSPAITVNFPAVIKSTWVTASCFIDIVLTGSEIGRTALSRAGPQIDVKEVSRGPS